eukprot:1157574-Pelagomonas_calceolata.AAC.14
MVGVCVAWGGGALAMGWGCLWHRVGLLWHKVGSPWQKLGVPARTAISGVRIERVALHTSMHAPDSLEQPTCSVP